MHPACRGTLLEEYRMQVQKIDDYERAVYMTWLMSFERLSPQMATFFKLCAFLDHDSISEAIFQNAARKLVSGAVNTEAISISRDHVGISKFISNLLEIH